MSVQNRFTTSLRTANGTVTRDQTVESATAPVIDTSVATGQYRAALPTISYTAANLNSVYVVASQTTTIYVNGTDAKETISMSGTVSGGTFPLTFNAVTASGIPWNATASQVQTALNAISTIGGATHGSVICTGGPLPATPIVVQFSGDLAQAPQPTMTTSSASLTGGGTVAVASTVTGVAPDQTLALQAGIPSTWATGKLYANFLTANCVRLTASNASGSASQIQVYLGSN